VAWLGASAEDSDLALDIITRIGRDGTSTARTEDVRWKNEWKLAECLGADTFDRHFALAGIFGYNRQGGRHDVAIGHLSRFC
jgi:hypothetical protein